MNVIDAVDTRLYEDYRIRNI